MQFKLNEFEPEKIQEKEREKAEDEKIMQFLSGLSAQEIKDRLRNNPHPKSEWGDGTTWRHYYLEECEQRGRKILRDLGWPDNDDALYVNTPTGSINSLIHIITNSWGQETPWGVIELWEPYNPDKPNRYLIKYLEEELERLRKLKTMGNLNSYDKSDIKQIPAIEKEIEAEKSKGETK
jgi:hypothetical protein